MSKYFYIFCFKLLHFNFKYVKILGVKMYFDYTKGVCYMIIDLFHNKIVKDASTDAFVASVNNVLVPLLAQKYGDGIERITMYEDYISDELLYEGEWYYPLTVKLAGQDSFTSWIKWPVNKKSFKGGVPYACNDGVSVEFAFAGFVPSGFADKLHGRAIDYDDKAIKVKVEAITDDPVFLSGKYSQTFVDELARQITAEFARVLGITGIENSTMELQLVFAPGTYLEHTSENVTYRRLLLVDKGCQARDFWVKWTRLDGAVGYKVSDHVSSDSIKFELGEDVAQKIREKEYRFLAGANPNKYQAAMGKRTVTEWRDITKRAIKRGDVTKIVSETELATHAQDITEQLRALLGQTEQQPVSVADVPVVDNSFDPIAALAKSALEKEEVLYVEETLTPPEEESVFEIEDEPAPVVIDEPAEVVEEAPVEVVAEEPAEEIAEISVSEVELPETPVFVEEEPATEVGDTFEFNLGGDEGITFEEYVEAVDEVKESVPEAPVVIDHEAIRREIEAKVRLELETKARLEAEREAERLRLEHERLIEENERLSRLAKEAEERRLAEEAAKKAEEEARRLAEEQKQRELEEKAAAEARIRAEVEAKLRLEAEERARIAETARAAVEETKRLEAERAEKALREKEEALAREAERLRREEDERRAAEQKRLEEQRRREDEARRKREEEEAAKKISIISKHAKLLFRNSVDINVIKRIKTVVEETLVSEGKQKLNIHIKAYPNDSNSISLEIKLPQNEIDLLVLMMRNLGGASLGITKIIVE